MNLDELDAEFSHWYRAYKPSVRAVIAPLAGPGADVDALTQETFERFYRMLLNDEVRLEPLHVKRLLRKIASGKAIDAWRKAARHGEDCLETLPDASAWSSVARIYGPEAAFAYAEMLRAINALSDELRAALLLREYLGFSREDTAQVLGVKRASVSANVRRAKQRLLEQDPQLAHLRLNLEGGTA
ncbi:RNA polymerase sigma factor [Streptomyces sp. bgisy034]|uniref:RNA polymerase sigma factor n=1 Tax=Streptomyces sp. bgisy034 TaxID=3413774 RepID=UPI003EBDBC50